MLKRVSFDYHCRMKIPKDELVVRVAERSVKSVTGGRSHDLFKRTTDCTIVDIGFDGRSGL